MTTPAPTFTKRNCPISAAFVIAMRAEFGPDVKVVMLRENGVEYSSRASDTENK